MKSREEPGNMKRNTLPDPLASLIREAGNPAAEGIHFLLRIIFPGNNQSSDLNVTDLSGSRDKVHHHFPVTFKYFSVIPVRKSLKIDIHGVDIRSKFFQYNKFRGAVCDEHRFHAKFLYELCCI